MKLTINNNDGRGVLDYTPAVLRDIPLTITRRRNAWTHCHCGLDVLGSGLPVPADRAHVTVTDDAGTVLFSGFAQAEASPSVALAGTAGVQEKPVFTALEQAWLTEPEPQRSLASGVTHVLDADSVEMVLTTPPENAQSALATDVTLSGEQEADAYVTELFRGDGTTNVFTLTHAPFRESGSATLIADRFDDATWNSAVWMLADPGSYLALGAGGLSISGGTGIDGATLLQSAQPVEMGGTLVAEATGVLLNIGSDGILLGFYDGAPGHASCVAGVRVNGAAGAHTLTAVIGGVDQPTAYTFLAGHSYTLRVRLHCAEMQRVLTGYQAHVDGVLQTFGGGTVTAALRVVIEVQDLGLASSTLPTVLYDGALPASPAQGIFAPVNSTALNGSVAGISLSQGGSAWVVSTATDGSVVTRREGPVGTGADYAVALTGNITFDAGRVPQPGELVSVTYRRARRAVAHLQDAAAIAQRQQAGLPGLPSWSGHILRPAARSSADCVAAAQALLALAGGTATCRSGSVAWTGGIALSSDVAVGDTLELRTASETLALPVESLTITDGNCLPELLRYRAVFSQDRANSLSFTVSEGLAAELPSTVPVTPSTGALPPALLGLQVIAATTTALQIDCGADPAAGGGFEVRRGDANFGSANHGDLVVSSIVRGFTVPRVAFNERFFVRMFDNSTPRRYSPVSSVVVTNLPVS